MTCLLKFLFFNLRRSDRTVLDWSVALIFFRITCARLLLFPFLSISSSDGTWFTHVLFSEIRAQPQAARDVTALALPLSPPL